MSRKIRLVSPVSLLFSRWASSVPDEYPPPPTLPSEVTSDLGKKVLEKIQRGQTSYYSPKVTWRQATVRKASAASSDLQKIGKIDEPDGRQPSLSDGRNWLYNGVTQTQEGGSYRIEREWIASDRGGWDEDIYDD